MVDAWDAHDRPLHLVLPYQPFTIIVYDHHEPKYVMTKYVMTFVDWWHY